MKKHGSMNHIFRLVWSQVLNTWVAVAETTKGRGKGKNSRRKLIAASLSLTALSFAMPVAHAGPTALPAVNTLPSGYQVTAGSATVSSSGNTLNVQENGQRAAINWQTFSIGSNATVNFIQPNSSSVMLNRVVGNEQSVISGALNANGQVFLLNSNGLLFTKGASVNTGGLVASTLNISDSDFMAGRTTFTSNGSHSSVINQGTINAADGGYVAMLGNHVTNQGLITARLGTAILAAGDQVSLNFNGNSLVNVVVNKGTLNALVANQQAIIADGGLVILTAKGADTVLASAVNNTGEIRAQTIANQSGKIYLLGDMQNGTTNVSGTLDASAPNGSNGGFIETSAAHVRVTNDTKITTAAAMGLAGSWLIDPHDFTIAATASGTVTSGTPSGDISGATLGSALNNGNVTILSSQGSTVSGSGNINVNDTVTWAAHTLTLTAANNININAVMTASGAASLAMNPSTTNGGDTAVAGGTVLVGLNNSGFTGAVNFSGSGTLSIGGTIFTVINNSTSNSAGMTALQNINSGLSGNYVLGSNLDATGFTFTPIGTGLGAPFVGVFDGLGHTISNLTINLPSGAGVGLFGYGSLSSLPIRNVGLVNENVTGHYYVGGLIGYNYGAAISNCFVKNGTIIGQNYVGGLVGSNYNLISNSYSTGSLSGSYGYSAGGLVGANYGTVKNSYSTAGLSFPGIYTYYNGGLVGYNAGTVTNSYATGSVSGGGYYVGGLVGLNENGSINNSYSTGNANGKQYVGGLVGENLTGTINNTYSTAASVTATIPGDTGGLVGQNSGNVINSFFIGSGTAVSDNTGTVTGTSGLTSAQMMQQSNFVPAGTGANQWDFTNTWVMYNGSTTPLLQVFMTPLTVTANSSSTTYTGLAQSGSGVTYSVSPNMSNLMGTVGYSGTGTTIGTYTITPSGLFSNQQGYIITYASGTQTITPAPLTITASNVTKTYGQTPSLSAFTSSGLVNGETVGSVTETSAGTSATAGVPGSPYSITASAASGGTFSASNYVISYVNGGLTVTPASLTITASNATKTYGQTPSLSAFTSSGLVNGETIGSVSETSQGTSETAGVTGSPYNITASAASGGTFSASNYVISYVNGGLTVTPASLTITASNATKTYGQTPSLSAFTSSGLVNGETIGSVTETSAGTSATAGVPGSPYSITASAATGGTFSASNYTINYVNGGLTVTPAALTITASNATKTYGQTPSLSAFTSSGLINGETIGGVTETSTGAAVTTGVTGSPYSITASAASGGTFSANNYTINYVNGGLTVTPASLTITASNATKTYGQTSSVSAFTSSGLVNGETIGSVTETSAGTSATAGVTGSPYNITASAASGGTFSASNYTINYVNGGLTVTPASLTITASNTSKTYGQTPSLSAFTSSGLVNGETIGGVTETSTGAAVTAGVTGSPYSITASAASGGTFSASNYVISYVNGSLAVTPLAVSVGTVSGASRTFDGTASVASSLLTITNLINGDTATLTGNGTLASSGVGAEALTGLTGLSLNNPNYTLTAGTPSGTVNITAVVSSTDSSGTTNLGSVVANATIQGQTAITLPNPVVTQIGQGSANGQVSNYVNVVNPLPQISAAFNGNTQLAIISAPGENEPTQVVSMSQARAMMQPSGSATNSDGTTSDSGQGGSNTSDVRVPVSRNSLVDIVNGGVRLPNGVEQQLFVVKGQNP
ncbi:MBG domain-containing protein [Solimicrobium silvestre]|uniref:Filamentous hemagglutinin family N-terminal domain n=1 Tax=Solimicrobium silvestre TaxID=2099400 RepID=A0A2S9GZ20_9BURK|nr:MBG domain-containing protein [Solimicrobium silvestre]PRC92982.1 Filamentous hemagglutinin family N-terminal domain [Solimicrobium silvestre]